MIDAALECAPSPNGVSAPPVETCLQRLLRLTGETDPVPWQQRLLAAHVPVASPAVEWEDGILRVLAIAGRLVSYGN